MTKRPQLLLMIGTRSDPTAPISIFVTHGTGHDKKGKDSEPHVVSFSCGRLVTQLQQLASVPEHANGGTGHRDTTST